MADSRIAIVTGANKGIGYAIVRQLALQYPKSPLKSGPLLIYLTARDETRGKDALRAIEKDKPLVDANVLKGNGGDTEVKFHALDISNSESLKEFTSFLKKEHPDGVDFVINNASIALPDFNADVVKQTLEINYYGALAASEAFLPLIRQKGRMVNLSSVAGSLTKYPAGLADRFRNAKSIDDVTKLMQEFQEATEQGKEKDKGFPSAAYAVSKAATTAFTKVLARDQEAVKKGVLVNSCHPGWVKTDMTKGAGWKEVDAGAQTPVQLALEDIGGQTGLYWSDEKVADW